MSWTLVTGGALRLGAEICLTLAKNGHDILVHYRNSRIEAEQIVQQCREFGVKAESIQGDFSSRQSTKMFLDKVVSEFHSVSNLINNVGIYSTQSALDTSPEECETLFQVNLHAPLMCIQELLSGIKQSQGSIINIGVAGLSSMRAPLSATVYRETKMSLLLLTKALARELAPDLVRVNMVSPGQLKGSIDQPQDLSKVPMHRLGTFDEVARVVAFLMDPQNQYITGQNIEVAGGLGL